MVCTYVYVSIIRDHVVGMELRPYGKNTQNSFEPKMRSVHAYFAEIQFFEGGDLKNPILQKNCLKFSD